MTIASPNRPRLSHIIGLCALGALAGTGMASTGAADAASRRMPEPTAVDAGAPGRTAILAGGCFWGVQGVFQHVKGVTSAVSGYAGGKQATAHYEDVSTGGTGHAEAVKITYDPSQISYGEILRIYFSVAHDPTELNRQGPDHGTQYRSAIFPRDASQAKIARAYIDQLSTANAYGRPIVTRIENGKAFYPAEAHHQDFLSRNPTYPYIVVNDLPKVEDLHRLFPERFRSSPVLTAANSN